MWNYTKEEKEVWALVKLRWWGTSSAEKNKAVECSDVEVFSVWSKNNKEADVAGSHRLGEGDRRVEM